MASMLTSSPAAGIAAPGARRAAAAGRALAPSRPLPARLGAPASRVARRAAQQDDPQPGSQPPTPMSTVDGQDGGAAVAAAKPAAAPNLFLEPLARNFILGIGAGMACEAAHVLYKLATASSKLHVGVAALLASHSDQLKPMFVADHAVAIVIWLALYGFEAAAISSVLRRFGHDTNAAAATVRSMPTLPKRIFPSSLNALKATVYRAARRVIPAASAALLPAPSPATTAATTAFPPLSTLDEDAAAAAAFAAATVVAERPAAAPAGERHGGVAGGGDGGDGDDEEGEGVTVRAPKLGRSLQKALEEIARMPQAPEEETLPRDERERRPGGDEGEGEQGLSRRDKEILERKSYLKNFWYAAALSQNLKRGKPLGVDILGTRVVLFRDEETGEVSCLDDACPHRGAPLSAGWLAKDKSEKKPAAPAAGKRAGGGCGSKKKGSTCVVCPYHGWAFDGEGKLRDVPSADAGTWPKRPLTGSYSVKESGGFVWLFYGDPALHEDERPPIPTIPQLEDPKWRAVYGEIEFDCGHWGVFDNAIDMAHIHYLHGDSFGNKDKPRIMDMQTSRDTFSCKAEFRIHNKPPNPLWEWTAVPSVPVTAQALLPSTSAVTITLGMGVQMITFVNTVPISADRAINRFCLIRNFATSPLLDGFARQSMFKILGEDKVMVDTLRADATPVEVSLAPDAPQLAFRKLRAEWARAGYLVAPEAPGGRPRKGLLDGVVAPPAAQQQQPPPRGGIGGEGGPRSCR